MIGAFPVLLSPKIAALSSLVMLGAAALDEKSTITIGAALVMVGSTWRTARMFQKFIDSQKNQTTRLVAVEERTSRIDRKVDELQKSVQLQNEKRSQDIRKINLQITELGRQRIFDIDNLRAELFGRRTVAHGKLLKVLLVDDDTTDRQMLRRALGGLYAVEEAESLTVAIEKTRVTQYDCILLDLYLPDSEPSQTVPRFLSENPTAVCITVSGTANEEHVNQAVKQGADSFIAKGNYDPIYLSRMIQNAIGRKQLSDPPNFK